VTYIEGTSKISPGRIDASVYALTELLLNKKRAPKGLVRATSRLR